MASPQIEDGYTPIANEIAEALCRVNLSAYESRILWFLFRKTYGWEKKTDWIALSQFSKGTGLDRRMVHRTLKHLEARKIIVIHRGDKRRIRYGFQKNYELWKLSPVQMTAVTCRDDRNALSNQSQKGFSDQELSSVGATEEGLSSVEMTTLSSIQPPTRETKQEKKKPPEEVLSQISVHRERYSSPELIDQAFDAIRITRKSGKVSPSVLLAQLQEWVRFPVEQVEAAIRTYLEKGYASDGTGKGERYLLGIIRKQKIEATPAAESTGSPLLDKYYREARSGGA
jgi:phage replication O-like protein O